MDLRCGSQLTEASGHARPAPAGLVEDRRAVQAAFTAVDTAHPEAIAQPEALPDTVSLEAFQSVAAEPALASFTDKYRKHGDELSRLGGSTCAIEAATTPGG